MTDIITIERELRAAGHQVERTFEAPVESRQELSEAQWVFRVDGEVVATGFSIGVLEENVGKWLDARSQ